MPDRGARRPHLARPRALLAAAMVCLATSAPAIAGESIEYPATDAGYTSIAELRDELQAYRTTHPDILDVFSIGRTVEGRPIWIAKVSDNVQAPAEVGEVEVLFDGLHHAREHLTVEQNLHILRLLLDRYGEKGELGQRVTRIVDERVTWIIFMVNPDGWAWDLSAPTRLRIHGPEGQPLYAAWRKNRSVLAGTNAKGIDLNRNYGYRWGCCGGSSGKPRSETYRGPGPWSAPEVRALRDFVDSRVIDGRQRIRAHITFHASGEQILYPYGYTRRNRPKDMTRLDRRTFVRLAADMAATNGYRPMQSSDLYVTDGDQIDWMYGRHRIFSFTFELHPGAGQVKIGQRFYPPDERIDEETLRNRAAVLHLLEAADCPYRAIGEADAYCGPFFDDLETGRGWTIDPRGTDTATDGRWVRAIPATSPYQRRDAASGQRVLVTGRRAGADVDGGRTTARSPVFRLPDRGSATLRLRYWVGTDGAAGPRDGLTIRIVDEAGSSIGGPLLRVGGDGAVHDPTWGVLAVSLPAAAVGRRVAIELVARDHAADGDATVEAGVDEVRVTLD